MKSIVSSLVSVMLLALMISATAAQPATPVGTAAEAQLESAVTWLISQQGSDGGFPGLSGESDPSITIDAVLALVASGLRGLDTAGAIAAANSYLASGDIALVYAQTGAGQAAKLVLATVATGGDPRNVAGVDPLSLVEAGHSSETGLYGNSVFDHALALMAVSATGGEISEGAVTVLESTQAPEGGWAFDGSMDEGAADSNTTAMVLQALVAIGEGDSALADEAQAFLQMAIDEQHGVLYQPGAGFPADSSSTALTLQAMIALGEDTATDAWGQLPAALAAFQNESGAFHYNADDTTDNLFATVQSIPAAAGFAFPLVPVETDASAAATPAASAPDLPRTRAS
jgi:hypothetical protein